MARPRLAATLGALTGAGCPSLDGPPGCFCMPLPPRHSRLACPDALACFSTPVSPHPPHQAGKIPRLPGMVRRQRRAGRVGLPVVRGSPCAELVGKAELGGNVSRVSWRGRGPGGEDRWPPGTCCASLVATSRSEDGSAQAQRAPRGRGSQEAGARGADAGHPSLAPGAFELGSVTCGGGVVGCEA